MVFRGGPNPLPVVPVGPVSPGGPSPSNTVEGHIFFQSSLPATDISVRVYNRGFGGADTLLGEVRSDQQATTPSPTLPTRSRSTCRSAPSTPAAPKSHFRILTTRPGRAWCST